VLPLSGCVGMDEAAYQQDFAWFSGTGETYCHVLADPTPPPAPIRAEAGSVWPAQSAPVPTMLELLREARLGRPAQPVTPTRHRGGYGLCREAANTLPAGRTLGLCYAAGQ
jgi:hypothetical protein